jgi:hypothetical protein
MKDNKDMAVKLESELRKVLGLKLLVPEPPVPTPEQKQAVAAVHTAKAPGGKK